MQTAALRAVRASVTRSQFPIPESLIPFTVHRSPRSIGIYHLSATGHTSRCEFAKAIIRIMKEISGTPDGWASVNPVTPRHESQEERAILKYSIPPRPEGGGFVGVTG